MAVSPTNSTASFIRRSLDDFGGLRATAERLQQAISTGERLTRGSDDPVAASRLRTLARADRLGAVDEANATRAQGELTLAGDALSGIAEELIRARDLALQASSDTLSDDQRALIADEIDQIREGLIAAANARGTDGRALFAGQADGPAYALQPDGSATYLGTATVGELTVGEDIAIARGVTGPDVFDLPASAAQPDAFAFLASLATALRATTGDPASAARDALGTFDDTLNNVNRAQTVIGVRAAWIDNILIQQQNLSEARTREGGEVGGADITETIARLQQTLTVLEASQAGFVRVSNLSLFNAI